MAAGLGQVVFKALIGFGSCAALGLDAIVGDVTDRYTLADAGVGHAKAIVSTMPDIAHTSFLLQAAAGPR